MDVWSLQGLTVLPLTILAHVFAGSKDIRILSVHLRHSTHLVDLVACGSVQLPLMPLMAPVDPAKVATNRSNVCILNDAPKGQIRRDLLAGYYPGNANALLPNLQGMQTFSILLRCPR